MSRKNGEEKRFRGYVSKDFSRPFIQGFAEKAFLTTWHKVLTVRTHTHSNALVIGVAEEYSEFSCNRCSRYISQCEILKTEISADINDWCQTCYLATFLTMKNISFEDRVDAICYQLTVRMNHNRIAYVSNHMPWCGIKSYLSYRNMCDVCMLGSYETLLFMERHIPDNKVHGANMGSTGSCRPQMGPMNLAIRVDMHCSK